MHRVGEKIRRLRVQLGLTQSQLAGKELTRAFISQLENGHTKPSSESLSLIAARLGKSIAYFMDASDNDYHYSLKLLEDVIESDIKAGQWAQTLPKLQEALRLCRDSDNLKKEADLQFKYGQCLQRVHRTDEALDQFEDVLDKYKSLNEPLAMARTWLEMGRCYFMLEQFTSARRLCEKVARRTFGNKGAQDLYVTALTLLGTTHLYLGDDQAAIDAYRQALDAVDSSLAGAEWAGLAAGLAEAYRRMGATEQALAWNQRSIEVFRKIRHPSLVGAEHNQALIMLDLGRWEEAFAILCRVFAEYERRNAPYQQACVLEDMARYRIHTGALDQAERLCWQAIDLLTTRGSSKLRGQLYRSLGELYALRDQNDRARELLQISYELLHQVAATDEMLKTQAVVERLAPSPQTVG